MTTRYSLPTKNLSCLMEHPVLLGKLITWLNPILISDLLECAETTEFPGWKNGLFVKVFLLVLDRFKTPLKIENPSSLILFPVSQYSPTPDRPAFSREPLVFVPKCEPPRYYSLLCHETQTESEVQVN